MTSSWSLFWRRSHSPMGTTSACKFQCLKSQARKCLSSPSKPWIFSSYEGWLLFPLTVYLDSSSLPDLMWNWCIRSIATNGGENGHCWKYLDSHALSLQKIRPKMDICCHIRAGATQSSISSLDRFQKCLRPRRLINFYSWPFFPQTHCHKPFAALSMRRFWRIRFISSASSQAHNLMPLIPQTLGRISTILFIFHYVVT